MSDQRVENEALKALLAIVAPNSKMIKANLVLYNSLLVVIIGTMGKIAKLLHGINVHNETLSGFIA